MSKTSIKNGRIGCSRKKQNKRRSRPQLLENRQIPMSSRFLSSRC